MQKLIRHLVFEWSMLKPYVVCLFNTVDEVMWVLGHRDIKHAVELELSCRWLVREQCEPRTRNSNRIRGIHYWFAFQVGEFILNRFEFLIPDNIDIHIT